MAIAIKNISKWQCLVDVGKSMQCQLYSISIATWCYQVGAESVSDKGVQMYPN